MLIAADPEEPYLHGLQPPIIHRDIKPENLIRTPEQRIALVDFGAVQEVYRTTLSRSGTFVGTLGYMPPEQFYGQTSAASDLYSLGATLVFLLSGQSPADLPRQRLKLDFRSQISVSPAFGHWLDKMLEPALEDRFASATDALAALHALPGEPGQEGAAIAQPPNSDLFLRKTRTALQLEIPNRSWWHSRTFSLLVVNLLWNAIAIPGMAFLIAGAVVAILDSALDFVVAIFVVIFMALPIGLIGLISWLLWRMLRAAKGDRVTPIVDPQTTTLQYHFWPAKMTLSAATCDVELHQDEDWHAFLALYCRTATGPTLRRSRWSWPQQLQRPTRHRFGQMLAAAERAWLCREPSSFPTARYQTTASLEVSPTLAETESEHQPDSSLEIVCTAEALQIVVPPEGDVGMVAGLAIASLVGCCLFFPLGFAIPILVAIYQGRLF